MVSECRKIQFSKDDEDWVIHGCRLKSLFFFQAEDGIRDLVRSRGLGDVYKRQIVPAGAAAVEGKTIVGLTAPYARTYLIKSVKPAPLARGTSHLVLDLEAVDG